MWSFDVYDTCLCRNYAHPKDVFREVAVNNSSELERQLGEGWIEIFSDTLLYAVNEEYADLTTPVDVNATLALIPPVSGG